MCEFALFGFEGDHLSANVMAAARENVTPIQCYNKIPYNAMKLNVGEQNLPLSYSLLNKSIDGAVLSVLKKAEDREALILRVYNPSETDTIADSVAFTSPVTQWQETQLDEALLETVVDSQSFGELKPCQVKSFQVKF